MSNNSNIIAPVPTQSHPLCIQASTIGGISGKAEEGGPLFDGSLPLVGVELQTIQKNPRSYYGHFANAVDQLVDDERLEALERAVVGGVFIGFCCSYLLDPAIGFLARACLMYVPTIIGGPAIHAIRNAKMYASMDRQYARREETLAQWKAERISWLMRNNVSAECIEQASERIATLELMLKKVAPDTRARAKIAELPALSRFSSLLSNVFMDAPPNPERTALIPRNSIAPPTLMENLRETLDKWMGCVLIASIATGLTITLACGLHGAVVGLCLYALYIPYYFIALPRAQAEHARQSQKEKVYDAASFKERVANSRVFEDYPTN